MKLKMSNVKVSTILSYYSDGECWDHETVVIHIITVCVRTTRIARTPMDTYKVNDVNALNRTIVVTAVT